MRKKILLWACIGLVGATLVQIMILYTLPDFPDEIRLNEESYYQKINGDEQEIIVSMVRDIKQRAGLSSSPSVRKALESVVELEEILESSNWKMERAFKLRAFPDSAQRYTDEALAILKNLPELVKPAADEEFETMVSREEILRAPEELMGLAILKLQGDLLMNYERAFSALNQMTDATTIKFSQWGNLAEGNAASGWTQGLIAFNAPEAMRLNQKERIQVRISKQYISDLTESMNRSESTSVDSLSVSEIMLVKLMGDDFKITAFDEEEQGVTSTGYSQWEFEVTPQQSGEQELFLKVGAVYHVPNLGATKKYFPVYEKRILVRVSAWQVMAGFATERWEFLISTFLIPLGLWLFSRMRHRRRNQDTP